MLRFFARLFGRSSPEPERSVKPAPPPTLMGLHGDKPLDAKEHEMRKRYPSFAHTLRAKISGRWKRKGD